MAISCNAGRQEMLFGATVTLEGKGHCWTVSVTLSCLSIAFATAADAGYHGDLRNGHLVSLCGREVSDKVFCEVAGSTAR